jgi:hypothetical protein
MRENTLNAILFIGENILIYQDTLSIFQIIETADNNRFAILNSLPKHSKGRVESNYLLLDIQNKKILNSKIEEVDKTYINGSEIYFEKEDKLLILNYLNDDNEYSKLLIINIKL